MDKEEDENMKIFASLIVCLIWIISLAYFLIDVMSLPPYLTISLGSIAFMITRKLLF